jgi:class 3 adenylate cyclase/tetratricopeptide (TPR) repeat protein
MQCPRCQHENLPTAKFCQECATPLARPCTNCGSQLPPSAKFCPECAHPAGSVATSQARFTAPESYTPKHLAERILTSKSALEGERKQVTVLFADLKGSMELLADRDPEEARKILDPVLERMMEAVHRYEGTVNQVMGDGIMALFGAPLAHEDHAVRACYAALSMQESVKRYAEKLRRAEGVLVQIRVGLNSGEVVVRSIASDLHVDYTAVGQTTHLAARMEQLAPPGSVRLTGETARLTEGYVEVRSLGPIPVRGLSDTIEIFELTGAGQARTRLQAAALRGLTRFVGRDAEVEHLRRVLGQAGAGYGQVVAIVGEAGVGKSRLTYEFTHSHRVQDWLILEASSVSYGKATSYLPVIDLLKGYFKIGDRDDHRDMHAKVLGRVLGLDRALEFLLPPLLALLDVPVEDAAWQTLDPPQRRQRTLDAVKRVLLRESQVQPLLVVFEDLHWVGGETQALLDSLVDSLGSARLLLLVNYRPEYQHPWGSKTSYSQMRLDALPAESAGELLNALLGDDSGLAPLKERLVRDGNPFFLEETVRTLVETKALAGERGRYRLTRPVQAIQIPPTVQTILAARIDRLSPEDKRLLQTASVVGEDVPFVLLQAIAELPDEALRHGLEHLQAAEFLYETGLYPDLEYAFKHTLTHEVAYGSLLGDRRRALHAHVVSSMESLYAHRLNEFAERLGHHATRGEVWDRAVRYLRLAGKKAEARSAYREAVGVYEVALSALARLPESRATLTDCIHLHLALGNAFDALAEYESALHALWPAERAATALKDLLGLGRVLSRMCVDLRLLGRHEQAVDAGQRALAVADSLGNSELRAWARLRLSQAYYAVGDLTQASELLRHVVEAPPPESATRERLSLARTWLAIGLAPLGQFDEALLHGEEALRFAENADDPWALIAALAALALVHGSRGDLRRAIELAERGLALAETWTVKDWAWVLVGVLGGAYRLAGRIDEAIAYAERAVEFTPPGHRASALARLSATYLVAGRGADALQSAQQALELSRNQKERPNEARALHVLGELASHLDPPDIEIAEAKYHQALALGSEVHMRPLVAHCHLGLGNLSRRTGKRQEAHEHLTTAATMYREMDMRFYLEQAEAERAALG